MDQDKELRNWARRHFVGGESVGLLLHPVAKSQWEAMEAVAQNLGLTDDQVKAMTVEQILFTFNALPHDSKICSQRRVYRR